MEDYYKERQDLLDQITEQRKRFGKVDLSLLAEYDEKCLEIEWVEANESADYVDVDRRIL